MSINNNQYCCTKNIISAEKQAAITFHGPAPSERGLGGEASSSINFTKLVPYQ